MYASSFSCVLDISMSWSMSTEPSLCLVILVGYFSRGSTSLTILCRLFLHLARHCSALYSSPNSSVIRSATSFHVYLFCLNSIIRLCLSLLHFNRHTSFMRTPHHVR